jgi:hypothetical protein
VRRTVVEDRTVEAARAGTVVEEKDEKGKRGDEGGESVCVGGGGVRAGSENAITVGEGGVR